MATTTPNLGLTLTPQNGGSKTFQTFRMELAGDGATSNMMLIDAAIGELQSGKYTKPSGGIPASDLSSSVRASLALADSALQTAPVTSVNGQTGAVTLTIPNVSGKLDINQGAVNAGKVMTVDSSGNIVPVTPGGSGDPVQITIGDVDGLQAALNGKEPSITAGTTAQYFRGDKTWQTLNKSAVGLGNVPNVTTNNQTPTYSAASTRTNLTSGETLATALGKIRKWLGDLGTLAFQSSVSKADLESSVQTSLGKADSALQEHQSLAAYRTAAAQDVIDAGKQAMLTAGENITIVGNVISASGGGGDNEMTVFTMGTATYAQIKAAYDAGKDIVVHYETDNYYMPLTRYMPDANGGTFYFACWLSTGARYTSISNYRGWSSNVPAAITPVSSSTLTANGDMFIRSSGSVTRLGIGTESQVLTVVDGLPAWQDLETYDGDVEYLTAYAGGVH